MHEQPVRIPSLHGLRAISIGFVVISHLVGPDTFISWKGATGRLLGDLGPLGVRVFFIISGYLITSLLLRELDAKNHIQLTKFYFRRTFRIFPPYYFFLMVVIILQAAGWIELVSGDILHAVTYTINYHPERSWYIGHGWSLSVEEQFYLLWPAVLFLCGKRRGLWIACFIIMLCPIIRLGYYYFIPQLVKWEVDYRFETVADSIAIGCLLSAAHQWLKQEKLYYAILNSRLFILVPVIVFYTCSLYPSTRRNLLLGISIQNVGIAACIAWCIDNYSGRIGNILNSKPMVFIGEISYSVYLWQQLFLNPHSSSIISFFPLNLILVGLASLVSYYIIEQPSLEIRQRLETKIFPNTKRYGIQGRGTSFADSNMIMGSSTLAAKAPELSPKAQHGDG
jgi:peptidoglycan/LPS O-acetylase OafA/YrhL